jgi:phosphatidylglycerophosphatase A
MNPHDPPSAPSAPSSSAAGTAARRAAPPPWWLTAIVTWLGSGLAPRAPGTVGSLAALPFAAGLHWLAGPRAAAVLIAAAAIAFLVGWAASGTYVRRVREKDPGRVVIDEVAGQWLTLSIAPLDPLSYLLGFLWFRLFDVVKPWPVSWADRRLGGGLGIMADDIIAAGYAMAALWGTLAVVS